MVLGEGDVTDPVEAVFDLPVRSDPVGQGLQGGRVRAGDQVDGLGRPFALAGDGALQLGNLRGPR